MNSLIARLRAPGRNPSTGGRAGAGRPRIVPRGGGSGSGGADHR